MRNFSTDNDSRAFNSFLKANSLYFILALFLMYSLPLKSNDRIKQGLYFRSFEVDKDKRTSLDLTPNKSLVFNEGFSMEFDMKLRHEKHTFGYVFRIICNDTLNVDFLADITSGEANFLLVVKNRTVIQYKNEEIGNIIENSWIKVLFVFEPSGNSFSLSLNGIKKDVTFPAANLKKFGFCFGGNMHRNFFTTDIAPMTVKNIRFFDEKQRLIRYWELAKHASDCVYDECISDRATVLNPVWEIDSHVTWSKIATMVYTGQNYHIAFNREDGQFFFAKDKVIYIYDVKLHKVDTINALAGYPFNCNLSNLLVYDPNRHALISYDLESKNLSTFDFSTCRWDNNNNSGIIQRFLHHSRLFIAEDSLLVTFGGYGFHRYNSLLFKCFVNNNIWETAQLSASIPPRYLGSMGRLGDRQLLYFGGFGSESGEQEAFPRNYYDLYSIDIDAVSVKKIWELSNPEEQFTNSNSLVVDQSKGTFYTLAYPNMRYASVIMLHEYNLNKPEYRIVGDSIPYFFNDIDSYCDLFQTSDSTELFTVTSHISGNSSEINIYSMAFPPLSPDEITQYPSPHENFWLLLTLLPVGLAGVIAMYFYRQRKKKLSFKDVPGTTSINEPVQSEEEPIVYDNLFDETKPLSIDLLGSFRIVDSKGFDITKNFTPTITQLFLLLLMTTFKNGRGISSQEINKTLWYDKDDESARNNRNVYTTKLRSILKSFTEVRLENHAGFWTIQCDKTVFCDYERALILIKTLKNSNRFNKKLVVELADIALKGTLLPKIQQTEWLEPYQLDYTNQLIECLLTYSKNEEIKTDLLLLLKIADSILLHDDIDEDAIKLKCYALYRSGRKNQALQSFNNFTAIYEKLLAAKHHLVFEELIKPF